MSNIELHMRSNFFDQVVAGQKTLIVRVNDSTVQGLQANDIVELKAHNRSRDVRILGIRTYHNFEDMLRSENSSRILPGANKQQTLALLRNMYPPDQERLGVYMLEVRLV